MSKHLVVSPNEAADRLAIRELVEAYAHCADRRDANFAVYLPFYTSCSTSFVDDIDVVDRPIRLFHGTADDAAPIAPCRSHVERLQKAGKDVDLTECAGAHHAFDSPGTPVRRSQSQGRGHCLLNEDPVGRIVNRDTGLPLTATDACIGRGATLGYDARAHTKAIDDVKALLQRVFKLEPVR